MKKSFSNYKWKPMQIDGFVFNNDVPGLIGIEECIDYDSKILKTKKLKKAKRKLGSQITPTKTKKLKVLPAEEEEEKEEIDFTPSKRGSTANEIEQLIEEQPQKTEDDEDKVIAWTNYGIHPLLLQAIKDLGFHQPTEIQALTLPASIMGRRDILGAAETGSGKTLAFGLPILTGILKIKENKAKNDPDSESEGESESDEEEIDSNQVMGCVKVVKDISVKEKPSGKPLYALILTPTRELAMQVKNHLVAVAKYTGIKVAVVVGGMAAVKQERVLNSGPEVVVATPGRLWELIQQGNPHLSQMDNIKFLAIDETDRMLEKGHFQELHEILERVNFNEEKRKRRQNFVFSATLTMVHELPKHLVLKKKFRPKAGRAITQLTPDEKLQRIIEMLGITEPKVVDVTRKAGTAETLTECRISCAIDEKDYYVYYFLQKHPGRTLIFCNSIGCVKRLTTLFTLLNCRPVALHASMAQRQRLKNLDRFKQDERALLIATDVAARGLDIPCIEHVLHYQTPRTSEAYVHRSGRTARASRQGITVLLVEDGELTNYLKLCKTLGRTEDLPHFPVQQNILNAVKERVNLARDLDKLELQVKKANSESGWVQKAVEDMDIILDDLALKYDIKENKKYKRAADIKRKQLTGLLAQPLFPKGFSGKYPTISTGLNVELLLNPTKENAVDTMKSALATSTNQKGRKKAKWLFKVKSARNQKENQQKQNTDNFRHKKTI